MKPERTAPLLSDFFQIAYVTNDLEQAMDLYRREFGIRKFFIMPELAVVVSTPRGVETAKLRFAFVYVGDMQIELIQPTGGDCPIYAEPLPSTDFAIKFHHLGHAVHGGPEDWRHFREALDTHRHPIAIEGTTTSFLYIDERSRLGHYLEYIWFDEHVKTLFGTIPRQ
jgi:hypothetical protein